jgi:hypothetical protein
MSLELISALASVGTFIVIGASAVAALIQLRHLQSSNQLQAMLAIIDRWSGPEIRKIGQYVRYEMPAKITTAEYATSLLQNARDPAKHPEIALCDLWEQIGTMVKHGFIKEEPFLDLSGAQVTANWDVLAPAIGLLRHRVAGFEDLAAFENFEYLASRARAWQRAHPQGNYPKGMQRLGTPMPRPAAADLGAGRTL